MQNLTRETSTLAATAHLTIDWNTRRILPGGYAITLGNGSKEYTNVQDIAKAAHRRAERGWDVALTLRSTFGAEVLGTVSIDSATYLATGKHGYYIYVTRALLATLWASK